MKRIRFILTYIIKVKFTTVFFLLTLISLIESNSQVTFQKTFLQNSPGVQIEDGIEVLLIDSFNDLVFAGNSEDLFMQTRISSIYKSDINGTLNWLKYYFYYPTSNGIRSIVILPDGNYLAAGNLYDSSGTDGSSYLMKLDTAGIILWSKLIPFSGRALYLEKLYLSEENIYCAGTVNNFTLGSLTDNVMLKIDADGNVIWNRYLADTSEQRLFDITSTYDGGCVFIGTTLVRNFPVNTDLYFGKLDSLGNKLWTRQIALGGAEGTGSLIKETNEGGLLICSYTDSLGFGERDLLLIKTDENGNVLWSKLLGSSNWDNPTSMQINSDGDILISGTSIYSGNVASAFSIKTDSIGNIVTSTLYGMNNSTRLNCSVQKENTNIFIGGYNYFPPNGIWELYLVKTDSLNRSGCFEFPFTINDSTISMSSFEIVDSLNDAGITLIDITMNVIDQTINVIDSNHCFTNLVPEIFTSNKLIIFPSPNNGNFVLVNDVSDVGEYEIYNSNGMIVYKNDFYKNNSQFSLGFLSSGIYILRFIETVSQKSYIQKFIVQH
ncbi:MAG: T9SS type A sorting domain-containing protein [Bacteroidia bacterium]|nr:T9SS type A sorting domain-containing protein [Bacteroidia bacterium]